MDEIRIRPVRPEDAETMAAIYRYYVENTAITFDYEPWPAEKFREPVHPGFPYLAAERDGRVIGYAYAGPFKEKAAYDWSVELTVYVAPDARRTGAGRALYRELEAQLKERGICNLYACVSFATVEDETLTLDSVRFHEKEGYRIVGHFHQCGFKFGRWYDMVWMEKHI